MNHEGEEEDDPLRRKAHESAAKLRGRHARGDVEEALALLPELRDAREFHALLHLAEHLGRAGAADLLTRRLYAQALIETGSLCAAIDMLLRLLDDAPSGHREEAEARGLLGRAFKQMFLDRADRKTSAALDAMRHAIGAYREQYERDGIRFTWHGVNVLALVAFARRHGLEGVHADVSVARLARELLDALDAVAEEKRDPWYLATRAEVALGLTLATGRAEPVESALAAYLQHTGLKAFYVASTLRQFTEVWELETSPKPEIRGLLDVLRIRLLQLPGGALAISARDVARAQMVPKETLQAILGSQGPQTYRWWMAGLRAARSVGIIQRRAGSRVGTAFVVSARAIGWPSADPDERLVLTNYHVVNAMGEAPGIRPEQAEIVFEAHDPGVAYEVTELLWSSVVAQHDAALLRVRGLPSAIAPLAMTATLPPMPVPDGDPAPRVYVIGHPGGRELSFSFQDNELLDHEGPPNGKPQYEGVCRVHYKAPTELGSSGSPVFEAEAWQVLALHHSGGKGMPRLNGMGETYAANEGVALSAIVAAIARRA